MDTEPPLLFTPITFRSVTARNRIVVSPMCQYSSSDGGPQDWHLAHLGRLAMGGSGIVFTEETAVEARGRKTYHCAGIWSDLHIPNYRRLANFIRAMGAVPAMQLGHCGRKAACHGAQKDWAPLTKADAADGFPPWIGIAPSPLPAGPGFAAPREMTLQDIEDVCGAWADAAIRSDKAGYDILEIHGAHGYLIHQFLSPLTNMRRDKYGGTLEGRIRFPLQVAEYVRKAWPSVKPLFFRISVVDGRGGAWNVEDSIALATELKRRGVDVIDCSSGGITGKSDMPVVKRIPGYQVPFAECIRRDVGVATMAVGLITEARQAENILRAGQADLVALARELLWNPNWPAHAAKQLGFANPYDLMPPEYAHRLRRRDEVEMLPINRVDREPTPSEVALIETT